MKMHLDASMKLSNLAYRINLGLLLSFAAIHVSQAQPTPKNASSEIAAAKGSYVRARVVLVNPSVAFPVRLVENTLKEYGCNFYVHDKKQLSDLVNIIAEGEILEAVPPYERFRFDARIGIFLFAENENETKLVLQGRYWGDTPVHGLYNNSVLVEASDPYLSRKLRKWASGLPPNPSSDCDFITNSQTSPILRR